MRVKASSVHVQLLMLKLNLSHTRFFNDCQSLISQDLACRVINSPSNHSDSLCLARKVGGEAIKASFAQRSLVVEWFLKQGRSCRILARWFDRV